MTMGPSLGAAKSCHEGERVGGKALGVSLRLDDPEDRTWGWGQKATINGLIWEVNTA